MPKFFIESWIYTSSLDVVREAETWKNSKQLEGNDLALFHAGQGELTELARSQVDVLNAILRKNLLKASYASSLTLLVCPVIIFQNDHRLR